MLSNLLKIVVGEDLSLLKLIAVPCVVADRKLVDFLLELVDFGESTLERFEC
jgi:hypothetical protein